MISLENQGTELVILTINNLINDNCTSKSMRFQLCLAIFSNFQLFNYLNNYLIIIQFALNFYPSFNFLLSFFKIRKT